MQNKEKDSINLKKKVSGFGGKEGKGNMICHNHLKKLLKFCKQLRLEISSLDLGRYKKCCVTWQQI